MFSRIFIERPRFAIVISVVMVLTGIVSLYMLPVAEYPEIAPPTLFVQAQYPGASSEVIKETVAMPLEDQINGVDDLLYFSSSSDNSGFYQCQVTFQSGTNIDIAMVNLQNAVKRAEPKLPTDVTKYGINVEQRGNDILAMFAFQTDGTELNIMQLNNYIETNIKDAICRIDGVSSASVLSLQEYAMRVWLNPLRMSGLGITADDIATAIASQNLQAAAGAIGSEGANQYVTYKLNVKGRLVTPEEFGEIVIRHDSTDGSIVRLRDVARIEIGASTYCGKSSFDGHDCVALAVYKSPDANALSTVKAVQKELARWQEMMPKGCSHLIVYDPTEFITVSLREIIMTLVIALLLVVLITWLFLQDWRATLVPSIAIPVALMGTFPFLLAMNFSINVLTMFGLILVVGSLCDDAIVVVENTQSLMEREGLSPKQAALKCMSQITGAIIATTLVTVACYAPLAFYGGMVGNIYVQFAVSMCISLCLSTVVAMTLSPALCALLLRKPDGKTSLFFKPFNVVMDGSRKVYSLFVKLFVRHALITAILFGGVCYAMWYFYNHIESSFLPNEDKGQIICNIELPRGASVQRTNDVLQEIIDCTADIPGVEARMFVSGFSILSGTGENVGIGFFRLKTWDKRETPDLQIGAIMMALQKATSQIADAQIIMFTPPAINGLGATGGATFNICGIGDVTPDALSQVTGKFIQEVSSQPETSYAMTAYNANTPQLYLDINREKAETLGVRTSGIYGTLQSKLASYYVNDFTFGGRNYQVKLQSDAANRVSLSDITEIQVRNDQGEMVPLSSLGTLRYMVGPSQVTRFNKMTCASINAQAKPGVTSEQLYGVMERAELPEGYHLEWTGLSYQEKQNKGQIMFLMALAFTFAYLFLVAQYESWMIPVPVMLSVAFAVLGALIGLRVTGEPLSIYAQLGMVMLIGLAAKNAILMVEFSKQEREAGKSIFEAALNGGNLRYRAVLMTAWSFLFGVFPMVIAKGAGSGSRQAIGITTFSGMLLATIVGIIFVPALYALCQRIREFVKRQLHWRERE